MINFTASRNFVQRPFESGYYSRVAFIKLSGVGTQHLQFAMDIRLDPFANIQEDEMSWRRAKPSNPLYYAF